MFGSIGFTELILILFIVLIIFGAGKLPQLGEGLGKAIKGFKKSVHEADAIEAEAQAQAQAQVAGAPQGQDTQIPAQAGAAAPPAEASPAEQPAASMPPPSKG
ncbi:MAG: twin-arginine translocase TatA/TatE family subunit [Nitrospiraceae bacterium]